MKDVLTELDAWSGRGDAVALATVVGVKRSAPRPPGAKMAVGEHGDVTGAVSGGCVEGAVVDVAEAVLRSREPRLLHFGISDEEAWDVGLPCGGEIDVYVERVDAGATSAQRGFAELARSDGRGALVTDLRSGAKLLVRAGAGGRGERTGTLGDPELDRVAHGHAEALMWAERSELRDEHLFVDVCHPPPRVVCFGAVDFAASLCAVARTVGWRPYVVDPRGRFASAERFPSAEGVIAAWPDAACAQLGGIDRATAVAVIIHDPKLDDAALQAALRSEAFYIGAMGSRRAQAARHERLLAAGVTEDELARIAAPIGLDLGGLSSEETALSIVSEIVAVKHGREGGRLRGSRGRIHEVVE